jgi:hypothetical protein
MRTRVRESVLFLIPLGICLASSLECGGDPAAPEPPVPSTPSVSKIIGSEGGELAFAGEAWTIVPPGTLEDADVSRSLSGHAAATNNDRSAMDNAPYYSNIPTYEGSGQAVHPDVLYFPGGWNGYKYWMGMTPYPNSREQYENPSIIVCNQNCRSNDAIWINPPGIKNPISGLSSAGTTFSDCNIVYNDDTNEIWAYYRYVGRVYGDGLRDVIVFMQKSSNGADWSTRKQVYRTIGPGNFISPSIVKRENEWYMWYVKTSEGSKVVRLSSSDGLSWSNPADITFSSYFGGVNVIKPWHLDVAWIPSRQEYWMIYPGQDNISNSPVNNDIYFANSKDGMNWTEYSKRPIILRNQNSTWEHSLYRATILYYDNTGETCQKKDKRDITSLSPRSEDDAVVDVWYSAVGVSGMYTSNWRIGYTSKRYSDLCEYLTTPDKPSPGEEEPKPHLP